MRSIHDKVIKPHYATIHMHRPLPSEPRKEKKLPVTASLLDGKIWDSHNAKDTMKNEKQKEHDEIEHDDEHEDVHDSTHVPVPAVVEEDVPSNLVALRSPHPPRVGASATTNTTSGNDDDQVKIKDALTGLANCRSYRCIKRHHHRLKGKTPFNFPHFFLVGFQKCATTSINGHLRKHPQYLPGIQKEPHWFTVCRSQPPGPNCKAFTLEQYLTEFLRIREAAEGGLQAATVDASVDMAGRGALAAELRHRFPWLKIVIIMREPISRMISYTRMFDQRGEEWKGCGGKRPFGWVEEGLGRAGATYWPVLGQWVVAWPPEQLHVMQFEELQEDSERVMRQLKEFLGMDGEGAGGEPHRPGSGAVFRNINDRKSKGGGYEMSREEYDRLVEIVRDPSEKVASLLEEKGLYNATLWLGRWQAVWEGVRSEACDAATGQCVINSN